MTGPILVIGARGQVGRDLVALAMARRVPVVGFSRAELNIVDGHGVRAAIDVNRPAAVVNAAAVSSVGRAEREAELAAEVNTAGAEAVAAACGDAQVPLIQLSCDCVFDGNKKSAYVENDPVAPLGVYGRTKADAEAKVRALAPRHIILRTSWIFGPYGRNFVRAVLRFAAERDELRMVGDHFGCPTATVDLSEAILVAARKVSEKPAISGTFHFAGAGVTSWHGFAEEIVRRQSVFTGRSPKVVAIRSSEYAGASKRPPNGELDSGKFHATFGFRARPWQERVAEVVAVLAGKGRPAVTPPNSTTSPVANAEPEAPPAAEPSAQ